MRGATSTTPDSLSVSAISTHAPLARCDYATEAQVNTCYGNFYSRTSCEVRLGSVSTTETTTHFYSRTSCEVRRDLVNFVAQAGNFYSRTSCEVRHNCVRCFILYIRFLLTHLLRGATVMTTLISSITKFLLTHLLRGATIFSRLQIKAI